jgi:O-6-methylguanine DNA methyltransferase
MRKEESVYKVVSRIPKGKVTTYGTIAIAVGMKSPRTVGNILHKNKDPETIPCHRVINQLGKVAKSYAFGGEEVQRKRLEREGVIFKEGKIDLHEFLWIPRLD